MEKQQQIRTIPGGPCSKTLPHPDRIPDFIMWSEIEVRVLPIQSWTCCDLQLTLKQSIAHGGGHGERKNNIFKQ